MQFGVIIIGGGPAGTGPLLKALKDGSFAGLQEEGIAVIEDSPGLLYGSLTSYKINSDTVLDAFLECLDGSFSQYIDPSQFAEEIDYVRGYKGRSIQLRSLHSYFTRLGESLAKLLDHPRCRVFLNKRAERVVKKADGSFEVYLEGSDEPLLTRKLIMATGGKPVSGKNEEACYAEKVALGAYRQKTLHSDEIINGSADDFLTAQLQQKAEVVILGGSHSAFSSACYLLEQMRETGFSPGAIRIYGKALPKIFFATREEAQQNNYSDFTDDDFCPVTKRLYRLAGLRMDGRALYMRMLGMLPGETENRVEFRLYEDDAEELEAALENAGLVIRAFGYTFNAVPLYDENGKRIPFLGETTGRWVNRSCQLLDSENRQIPGLYGIGLASGFIPSGELGGESSFSGQTNGIWYYQNVLGDIILQQILSTSIETI